MLRNYLKIALRNLWRNKLYTILNVAGLSIGISTCIVIYLIVHHEFSFDTFHPDRDRIYRIYTQFSGAFIATSHGVTAPLYKAVREEGSGIETVTAFHLLTADVEIPEKGKKVKLFENQQDIAIADRQYFEVFSSYRWLAGTPKTALTEPFQVVLTKSKAMKYFGGMDIRQVLGRQVRYRDSLTVTVAGIVEELPQPTDLYFQDFISFGTIERSWLKSSVNFDSWDNTNSSSQLFIKLTPGAMPQSIAAQLPKIVAKHEKKEADQDWKRDFRLQAFSELHFDSELGIFDNNSRSIAHLPTLRTLTVVALLLLLIAAINFINLITAQATRRAKEVGVRKLLGGTRGKLIVQFLSETAVLTLLAVLFSLLLADVALRYFREFIPAGVALHLHSPSLLLFLLVTLGGVSVLAGLYPAFVLSGYAPALALKNQIKAGSSQTRVAYLRKGLIIFQFAFAQLLILGTVMVSRQINYMLNKDMGFQKDAVVYFYTPWYGKDQRAVLKQELANVPGIKYLSMNDGPPAEFGYKSSIIDFNTGKKVLKHNVYRKFGDTTFIHLYRIPFLAGRNLLPSDTLKELLINETYAKKLGFRQPAEALGHTLHFNDRDFPIVGVIKDFHIQSLHNPLQPVVIGNETKNFYCFALRLATAGRGADAFKATITQVERVWKQLYPDQKFKYSFLDEQLARFYQSEQRIAKLMQVTTGIAILVSCLGLFGLVAYTAEQRTKEIGIRKVLGATVASIVALLSKDFLRLVVLANLLAWPLARYGIHRWLRDFAYQVDMRWWVFGAAGGLAVLIALLTISYQSIRAALANPVKSLRSE